MADPFTCFYMLFTLEYMDSPPHKVVSNLQVHHLHKDTWRARLEPLRAREQGHPLFN